MELRRRWMLQVGAREERDRDQASSGATNGIVLFPISTIRFSWGVSMSGAIALHTSRVIPASWPRG